MLPKESYKRIPILVLYAAVALFFGYVFLKFLLPALMPFFIAWVIALLLQNIINKLYDKARIPKKLSAFVLVLLVAAALAAICYLLIKRVYGELSIFAENASDFLTKAHEDPEFAAKWIKRIDSAVPFLNIERWLTNVWKNIDVRLENATVSIITNLTSKILPILGDIITFVPEALMYIFVIVFSSYYFAVDFDKINRLIIRIMPKGARRYASAAKKEMSGTLGKLLKAYGLIIIITFTELFIFLSIIGVKYSLIIAFFISLIDILPVLGTGTVLIPWGLALIILGQTGKGAAILGAYAFITIAREIIEPKIIGKSIGIHPLAALAAMYAGLKLFGIVGMFVLPLSVMLIKNIYTKSGLSNIIKEGSGSKPAE